METQDLLKQVRRIEIKTRRLTNNIFAGEYHSAFKGRGMSFSEVREYQPGDDVRDIDWNVTARTNRPYVKVYEEERELTVMLLVDVPWWRPVSGLLVAIVVAVVLARHCHRRFAGLNGDTCGFVIEVTATVFACWMVL